MKSIKHYLKNSSGLTIVELFFSAGILATVIVSIMQLFVYCSMLSESARNTTLALAEAQNKIEEIRNHWHSDIPTDYSSPADVFNLTQLNGTGTISFDSTDSYLYDINIDISWTGRNGRQITQRYEFQTAERL